MKVYTEIQLLEAIDRAIFSKSNINSFDILEDLTPIQLPSDEEIKQLNPYPFASTERNLIWHFGAKEIVKLIEDKIQGGNNEQL